MNKPSFHRRALLTACALAAVLTACDNARTVMEPQREVERPRMTVTADSAQVLTDGGSLDGGEYLMDLAPDTTSNDAARRGGGTVGSGH